MLVDLKSVMLGLDRRTSIIIKNIPEDISDEELKKIVLNYESDINFFYIQNNIKT